MILNVKIWRNINFDYVIESYGFKFCLFGIWIFLSLCFLMYLYLILSCYIIMYYFYDVN